MATGQVACRLFGIMASAAPVCAVLRRGPSKWCQLVRWDTQTDKIHRGDWFRGRVYERRCDVSPDGQLLVYFGMEGEACATAVSKVPFWEPLVTWQKDDCLSGGGLFIDDRTVFVDGGRGILRGTAKVDVVREQPWGPGGNNECLGTYFPRMRREGWEMGRVELLDKYTTRARWAKERSGMVLARWTAGRTGDGTGSLYFDAYEWVGKDGRARPMAKVEWADWDQRGRLVFAREGRLYRGRVEGGEMAETLVADLNGGDPERVRLPEWARSW